MPDGGRMPPGIGPPAALDVEADAAVEAAAPPPAAAPAAALAAKLLVDCSSWTRAPLSTVMLDSLSASSSDDLRELDKQ